MTRCSIAQRLLRCIRFGNMQAAVTQALGAFKSVGMLGFMMWMSGSQLHIFSIMSTISGLLQPISAILSSGKGDIKIRVDLNANTAHCICLDMSASHKP